MEKSTADLAVIVIKLIFLCVFIACGIVGNCTVLVSIKKYRKLQTVPNFFVFNLAVADFLFSMMGMPMILITTIYDQWVLGEFLCNVNGLLNSLFCTTSIWTLVMIGVNRYLSVARPRDIRKIYTKRKTCVIIVCVWLFSFLVSMPPLFGWSEFAAGSNFCTVNGKVGLSYGVFLIFTDYVLPLLLLGGLYLRIFFLLRRNKVNFLKARNNSGPREYSSPENTLDGNSSVTGDFTEESESVSYANRKSPELKRKNFEQRILSLKKQRIKIKFCRKNDKEERANKNCHENLRKERSSPIKEDGSTAVPFGNENEPLRNENEPSKNEKERSIIIGLKKESQSPSACHQLLNTQAMSKNCGNSPKVVRTISLKEEGSTGPLRRKRSLNKRRQVSTFKRFFNELDVTRMLLIVVLAFFLCWTTFMVSSVLYAFNVAPKKFKLLTLGIYVACLNSIINPLIYALMNRNFRHYFKKLYRGTKRDCKCFAA